MPVRTSESILQALVAAVIAQAPAGAEVVRNDAETESLPAEGLIVVRDGDPGEPEVLLSPITYLFEHAAQVDVFVAGTEETRDLLFDDLVQAVGRAITTDRSLGGRCDWVEGSNPSPIDIAEEGAVPIKAASIAVILHYATTSPVG